MLHNTISTGPVDSRSRIRRQEEKAYDTTDGGHVQWDNLSRNVVQVHHRHAQTAPVGATFTFPPNDSFYGRVGVSVEWRHHQRKPQRI